jgi:hypothetical protein
MRLVTIALALAVPSVALAHVTLTYPPPRTTQQKVGPCGVANSVRGTNVTTLQPGATITVTWDETIQHPGHFRISFDADGQAFSVPPDATSDTKATDPNVIEDLIPDTTGRAYSKQITLPNMECANCTLQLIQLMTDKPPYTTDAASNDIYYQCADIRLSAGGSGTPDAGIDGASDSGGCNSMPSASLGGVLVALGMLRRRSRR